MSTSTTVASGLSWSRETLHDGWGVEECAERLGDLVVSLFEELVEAHGGNAVWLPVTSSVVGQVYGQNTDEHSMWEETDPLPDGTSYADLRDQARRTVWDALVGDESPTSVSTKVGQILGENNA